MKFDLSIIRSFLARGDRRSSMPLGAGFAPSAPILSGAHVTPATALGLASVYASINVISRDVACLPVNVYRKLPGGARAIDETHPVYPLLRVAPNDELDAFRFHRDSMGHTLGHGNGFAEIVRAKGAKGNGTPEELQLLHPSKTIPKRRPNGALYYELENKRELLPEDVLHFAGLGFDGLRGWSPIAVARQTVGLSMAVEQFGASFFGNGAIARGILKLAKRLKTESLDNLRRSVNQVHQGAAAAHQFMILEEGMDWIQTQIAPEDAQFLATRSFQVLEIARLFSLPPHKIGDYSQSHMSNIEQANLDYLVTTLAGWIDMREAQFNLKLLSAEDRKTHEIRHDFSALLRGDAASRVAYYQGLRNLGAINADEIRVREGMNPIGPAEGGDLYLVQSQYTRLKAAGVAPEPAAKSRSSVLPRRRFHRRTAA